MLSGPFYSNPFATLLSGGVGGARMARALAMVLEPGALDVVVNVGDDDRMYGLHVSADVDTVLYTLAGIEGPHGWGIAGDTFTVMRALAGMGVDTTFRLGDRDLAHCLRRTELLDSDHPLSATIDELRRALGVAVDVMPATDDPVRTRILTADGAWRSFQEYFVLRGHRDDVAAVEYAGAGDAKPAPGVVESIERSDLVIVAPSNPPLSVAPVLAVPGVRETIAGARRVVAVSPLFGGKPLKGPADRVMAGIGLPAGNAGILAAYDGVITDLVVDLEDEEDVEELGGPVRVHAADTHLTEPASAARFARWLVETFGT